MKLKPLVSTLLFLGFLALPLPVFAKKKLPVRKTTTPRPYGAWVKPKLRKDRHALLLMIGGVNDAETIDYTLIYNAGPIAQGIKSYHTPEDGNTQKELVFGTCSGTDCIYHGNINDMKLTVEIKLISGQTIIWRYAINP